MNEEFWDEHHFDDWDELQEYFKSLGTRWIFRGQRLSCWPLKSSLERAVSGSGAKDLAGTRDVERFLVFQFQRRAHNYLEASLIPRDDDDPEWLALMQHHGAPTRLLDFSKSPYVATFFALEDGDESEPCAVWAVDKDWSLERTLDKIARCDAFRDVHPDDLKWDFSDPARLKQRFPLLFFDRESPLSLVLGFEPYRMNERLTVQQGCFLCPGDVRRSFMENLKDSCDPEDAHEHVQKLVIERKARTIALGDLYLMNITRASLFPGIDGFAASLKHQLVADNEHLARMQAKSIIDEMYRDRRRKARIGQTRV